MEKGKNFYELKENDKVYRITLRKEPQGHILEISEDNKSLKTTIRSSYMKWITTEMVEGNFYINEYSMQNNCLDVLFSNENGDYYTRVNADRLKSEVFIVQDFTGYKIYATSKNKLKKITLALIDEIMKVSVDNHVNELDSINSTKLDIMNLKIN